MLNKKLVLTYFISIILIFNAGWIDSVVLYKSFGASVAAMTGNFRILGHSIAEHDLIFAYHVFVLIIGFIIGAAINGALISNKTYILSKNHTKVLILQSVIILMGTIFIDVHNNNMIIDDIFLAMSMGMQNSFTTLFFGSFARTTHMTGTTTDLGIELGRVLTGNFANLWKIPFFSVCIIMFTLGNAAGVIWVNYTGDFFTIMLIPSILLPIFVGLVLLYMRKISLNKKYY